jgi:L-aminopeptidase/D-esterase-like protein
MPPFGGGIEVTMASSNPYSFAVGAEAQLPAGFLIGNAQNVEAATGCTVLLCPAGATASVKVLGGAPATRETDLLNSENMVEAIHAVVLSGGSAFGLDACSGVMHNLEQRNVGMPFSGSVVPIVAGASLFDLGVGDGSARPDSQMGFAAVEAAFSGNGGFAVGNAGAGTGASVGKLLGPQTAMKSGLGAASVTVGELVVTAVVAVNAAGNVYDRNNNSWLAGVLDPGSLPDKPAILDPYIAFNLMLQAAAASTGASAAATTDAAAADPNAVGNTTIGCILTNAALSKPQAAKVALMAHDGYARSIEPVHTSFDGDAIFCMAHGSAPAQQDFVGALAAQTIEQAVHNAALSAQSAYGLLASPHIQNPRHSPV